MDVREEWSKFYGWFWMSIENDTSMFIDFTSDQDRLWKAAWFIYFFGSFYKYNGESQDRDYVAACYMFLYEILEFKDGEPFDIEGFFFKAFPK